uniref:patatin-like phospholipase family protein n=1 Tax=Flavobacterium sp. TaxID=239 RepID=UPI00404B18EE
MDTPSNETFSIGLCMAGAISAGAYTAGVMDYLLEALEAWQQRKDSNEANVPSHQVAITVLGGSSAGGMTGIIAAAALQEEIKPVRLEDLKALEEIPENRCYHSWVDLVGKDMLERLLDTKDIKKKGLKSLLNASFIDELAERATYISNVPVPPKRYIAEKLKVFVTVSNLEGMHHGTHFSANVDKFKDYVMTSHNDYICFQQAESENDYEQKGWIPLNFKKKLNIDLAKDAAMATGAFPVGLKARKISRKVQYLKDNPWFAHIPKDENNQFAKNPFTTVNVDGGLINNEPFIKVQEILINNELEKIGVNKSKTNKSTEKKSRKMIANQMQDANQFKSTVLMIDPFPSEPTTFDDSTALMNAVANTLNALVGQSRVKPEAIRDALQVHKTGQFLIAPVRYEKKEGEHIKIEGEKAIASGSLSGFGGFISKEFRVHDFFLGRANCEIFLRDHFTIPLDHTNDIFKNGYANVQDATRFHAKDGKSIQIIPIFTERNTDDEPPMPVFSNQQKWPTVSKNLILEKDKLMRKRIEKILLSLVDSCKYKFLLSIGCKIFINKKIATKLRKTILKSLKEHALLK